MSSNAAQSILTGMVVGDVLGIASRSPSLSQIYLKNAEQGIEKLPDPIILSNTWQEASTLLSQYAISGKLGNIETSALSNLLFCALLGFIHQHNEEKLKRVIFENFSSRDSSDMDIASSLASAYLVKLALDSVPPGAYFEKVWQFCSGMSEEFDMTIRKIGHVLGWGSETHAMRHLGKGQTNAEIITLASYCVLRYSDDYISAIQCAANTVKNNHIIAGITGAIMGTRLGLEAIPEAWYNGLQNRKYILKLSQTLSDIRESHAE